MLLSHRPKILAHGLDRIDINVWSPTLRYHLNWDHLIKSSPVHIGEAIATICSIREGEGHEYGNRSYKPSGPQSCKQPQANTIGSDLILIPTDQINPDGLTRYILALTARGCARLGTRLIIERGLQLIDHIFHGPAPRMEATRIELYVDLQRTSVPSKRSLKQIRCLAGFADTGEAITKSTTDLCGEKRLTLGRSSSGLSAAYYEKRHSPEEPWRLQHWQRGGLLSLNGIRRLEFRIRGKRRLEELGIDPSPRALLAGGLNALWRYLTSQWLWVPDPEIPSQPHEFWQEIQALHPVPDAPILPMDFQPYRETNAEGIIATGAGLLRRASGLPDTPEGRKRAREGFLVAVERAKKG